MYSPKDIIILIPIYKSEIDIFERVSLLQAFSVFKEYEICLIAPKSLQITYKELAEHKYRVERFEDCYFESKKTYSALMLEIDFYKQFDNYKYMLIYQLDAFVFYDNLLEFCDWNYDYIGATTVHGWTKKYVVGNGGLSLRKVDGIKRLLKYKDYIFEKSGYKKLFEDAEDNFFSYCGDDNEIDFSVPSCSDAVKFSVQRDVCHGIRDVSRRGLPFGIHYFPAVNYEYWRSIIQSFGYILPSTDTIEFENEIENSRRERYEKFFFLHPNLMSDRGVDSLINDIGLDKEATYVLWGIGREGKKLCSFLNKIGIKIGIIFDKRYDDINEYKGVAVVSPNYSMVSEFDGVIIGTYRYEKEIINLLLSQTDICGRQCYLLSELMHRLHMIKELYIDEFPKIEGITCGFINDIDLIYEKMVL